MTGNMIVRQSHRWLSIVFTGIVMAIFASLGMGLTPVAWVYYLPLPPLALMLLTGLYLFALPYVTKRRNRRSDSVILPDLPHQ